MWCSGFWNYWSKRPSMKLRLTIFWTKIILKMSSFMKDHSHCMFLCLTQLTTFLRCCLLRVKHWSKESLLKFWQSTTNCFNHTNLPLTKVDNRKSKSCGLWFTRLISLIWNQELHVCLSSLFLRKPLTATRSNCLIRPASKKSSWKVIQIINKKVKFQKATSPSYKI